MGTELMSVYKPGNVAAYVATKLRSEGNSTYVGKGPECVCLVCGEPLNIFTHCHANKCGYASKEEMVAAGKIKFLHGPQKHP